MELKRNEAEFRSADAIVDYLKVQIGNSESARFIKVFDRYAHTHGPYQGQVAPEIRAAKNLLFCFGLALQDPWALAFRPRYLGVAAVDTCFLISFLEPPTPVEGQLTENWVMGLANRRTA